jgi:hypothetical protein
MSIRLGAWVFGVPRCLKIEYSPNPECYLHSGPRQAGGEPTISQFQKEPRFSNENGLFRKKTNLKRT